MSQAERIYDKAKELLKRKAAKVGVIGATALAAAGCGVGEQATGATNPNRPASVPTAVGGGHNAHPSAPQPTAETTTTIQTSETQHSHTGATTTSTSTSEHNSNYVTPPGLMGAEVIAPVSQPETAEEAVMNSVTSSLNQDFLKRHNITAKDVEEALENGKASIYEGAPSKIGPDKSVVGTKVISSAQTELSPTAQGGIEAVFDKH